MGGSKSAKGSPNPLANMDRGVQIRCDTGAFLHKLSYQANRELVVMWVSLLSDKSVFKSSDRFYANSDHLTPKSRNVSLKQQSFPGLQ